MDMNIRQCRICGKLFQSLGRPVCPNCLDEMDIAFKKVREDLYDHPHSDVLDISARTGVPEKWILEFLKDERLALDTQDSTLRCEHCGRPVQQGKYCKKCSETLMRLFDTAGASGASRSGAAERTDRTERVGQKATGRAPEAEASYRRNVKMNS